MDFGLNRSFSVSIFIILVILLGFSFFHGNVYANPTFLGMIGNCTSGTQCNSTSHATTGFCGDCSPKPASSGNGQFGFFGNGHIALENSSGIIYVSDGGNNRVDKFDSFGNFQGWIGDCSSGTNCTTTSHATTGFCTNCAIGSAGTFNGQFSTAGGIATDKQGNIYVQDTINNRVEKFNSAGTFQGWIGGCTSSVSANCDTVNHVTKVFCSDCVLLNVGGGGNGQFEFLGPSGIAFDQSGNFYVSDEASERVQKFNSAGTFQGWIGGCSTGLLGCNTTNHVTKGFCNDCSTFGSGSGNGQFAAPSGITSDSSGNLYVSDSHDRIQKFNSAGTFQGWIGGCSTGTNCNIGHQITTKFCQDCVVDSIPGATYQGIAIDKQGNIYVVNSPNQRVDKFNSAGAFQGWFGDCSSGTNCDTFNEVTTGFCNDCTTPPHNAGSSSNGGFLGPLDIAFYHSPTINGINDIYVVDNGNNRVEKFFVNPLEISLSVDSSGSAGPVGEPVIIRGYGFDSNSTVTFTFDGNPLVTTPATVTTNASGETPANVTFTVPSSSLGLKTVQAIQGTNTPTTDFLVTPELTLSPTSGPVGTKVTITGNQYPPNTVEKFYHYTNSPNLATTPATVTTDASGNIPPNVTFSFPPTSPGDNTIFAYHGSNVFNPDAWDVFTIIPDISLSPTSGPVGTKVTITGNGFDLNSTIPFTFDGNPLVTTPAAVNTNASGSIPGNVTFTVPASTAGAKIVQATHGFFPMTVGPTANFTVILPCSPPGSGNWTVTSSCTLTSTSTAPASVIVNNGAVLTIPSGETLTIHFKTNQLIVHNGGGVLIQAGGAIN